MKIPGGIFLSKCRCFLSTQTEKLQNQKVKLPINKRESEQQGLANGQRVRTSRKKKKNKSHLRNSIKK